MINKKKLLSIIIVLFIIAIIFFFSFYFFSSQQETGELSNQPSILSVFKQKQPLATYFFSSSALSATTFAAYQLAPLSIYEVSSSIQEALNHQFSLIQQTNDSFTLDIFSLQDNSALEGCNNSDIEEDEFFVEPPEDRSVDEVGTIENDISYRSHCESLRSTVRYPIAELETAEVVFQEFKNQYSFYPYFIVSDFVQTSSGFTASYSYATDQNYALVYTDSYSPLTINFDQTMQPTTLVFNGQYLPVKNNLETLSLLDLNLVLTQLNQKQIIPTFKQNFLPSEKDFFSIAHIDLIYYYQNNQYLPYYQMSGKIVDSDNFSTDQVFTFTVPATQ